MEDDYNTTIKDAFQEPRKRFWLRSRKRPKSDAISINSMDISIESDLGKKKKRRRITEVANSIFSSTSIGSKLGNTLHSSFSIQPHSSEISFMEEDLETGTIRKKRKSNVGDCSSLTLKSWILDVANANIRERSDNILSRTEVKRQEAIYELYCGENVLLQDLHLLKELYYDPLLSSGIFNSNKLSIIFGDVSQLIEIHSKLRDELLKLRDQSGFTKSVGSTILNWLPTTVEPYLTRCKTQVWAKHLLEEKKATNKRFQTFLKKRLESPHSVDLWTYLDVPRSRIVKYPLLLREIMRHTPINHVDQEPLKDGIDLLTKLLKNIDSTMGDAECKLAQSKINVKSNNEVEKLIKSATELITEGPLRDIRGVKFHCFLFNTCFVIARRTKRIGRKYNFYSYVIPSEQLFAFNEEKDCGEFGFKIGDHFLTTEDSHGKRHWLDSFNKVLRCNIKTLNAVTNNNEKENQLDSPHLKSNKGRRKSLSNISDHNGSFSLKKIF